MTSLVYLCARPQGGAAAAEYESFRTAMRLGEDELERWDLVRETLPSDFTARWPSRILNVHPALIPSFCGPGMYGLRPHQAALARGCKVTGATVHFVNEECDGGPILLQKAVEILPGDTPEVLQKRVMEQAEWKLLPKAVAMVCSGEIE